MSGMKRCPTCGETDPSKFGTDAHRPDKLRAKCKKCHNQRNLAWYYQHHEERKAYARAYNQAHYAAHYEKKIAYKREWQRTHPEKVRLYHRQQQANPTYQAGQRAYKQTPKSKAYTQAYNQAYYQKNKQQIKQRRQQAQQKGEGLV